MFIGRTDVEAETPILWPPDVKRWLTWKDPDAGKDWGQEEKGMTEDEMVGWHHWLNGHGFGWTPGVGDGQGGLLCCSSWGHKELDTTEWLNWTENISKEKPRELIFGNFNYTRSPKGVSFLLNERTLISNLYPHEEIRRICNFIGKYKKQYKYILVALFLLFDFWK